MCEAAGEVSTCVTCSHSTGQVVFPRLLPQVSESQRPSETLINSYRSAFQEGQGGCFLPREHYANSAVKHIGIMLPFASAVLADSMGASSPPSEHRGLVLGRERFSCSLCCSHTGNVPVDLSVNLFFV